MSIRSEILDRLPARWKGPDTKLTEAGVLVGVAAVVATALALAALVTETGLALVLGLVLATVSITFAWLGLAGRPSLLVLAGASALAAVGLLAFGVSFTRPAPVAFAVLLLAIAGVAALVAGLEPWRGSHTTITPSKPEREPTQTKQVEPPRSAV